MVGCQLVQVGTANFVNPNVMVEIANGMGKYLKQNNFKSIDEIRNII